VKKFSKNKDFPEAIKKWVNGINNIEKGGVDVVIEIYGEKYDKVLFPTFGNGEWLNIEDARKYFEGSGIVGVEIDEILYFHKFEDNEIEVCRLLYTFMKEENGEKIEVPAKAIFYILDGKIIKHRSVPIENL